MKVGQWFTGKNTTQDVYYYHTVGMLTALGLEKYEKNFRRGLLMDDCLALLSDSALKEVKIPAGPRLKILNYVAASKAHMARGGAQGGGEGGGGRLCTAAEMNAMLNV